MKAQHQTLTSGINREKRRPKRKRRGRRGKRSSVCSEGASKEIIEGVQNNPDKNRKRKQSLDENMKISKGNDLDTSLTTANAVSKNEKRRCTSIERHINGNLETNLQTAENHNEESGSLCNQEQTNIKHLDNKNHEVSMGNNLIPEGSGILLKSADNISKKVKITKTYQRKKGSHSMEPVKEGGSSTSIQIVQNSSGGGVSVHFSDNALSSEKSKWRNNGKNRKKEDEFKKAVRELSVSEERNSEELPKMSDVCSTSKLERVNEVGVGTLWQVVQDSSIGDVSVTCSESERASKESKRNIKTRMVNETFNRDSALRNMSTLKTSEEHLVEENKDELSKVMKSVREHELSVEENLEEFPTYCNKEEKSSSLETGNNIDYHHFSSLDPVHKQKSSSELCEEGCSTLSPSVETICVGNSSAHSADNSPEPTKGVREKENELKPIVHEEKTPNFTPPCDSFSKLLEQKDKEVINELKIAVEVCPVFSRENLEVSITECNMEKVSPCNRGIIKDVLVGTVNKKDSSLEKLPSLPERTPSCARRKLLILDLNGLLADIVSFAPDGYKADKHIAKKALFKRPFCDDFLKFCFERFDVGVWSSRNRKNVQSVVDFLMEDMKHKLLFCWDQSHCTETGFSTIENRNKPLVLKELRKLWDKHDPNLPWEKGEYNESNTLLVDDSPYKALRNPPHTAVFPTSFRFQDTEDNSLGPGGDLRVYLEGLTMAEDVQKYVEEHPFGQRAITSKNPSWGFYLRVIGT